MAVPPHVTNGLTVAFQSVCETMNAHIQEPSAQVRFSSFMMGLQRACTDYGLDLSVDAMEKLVRHFYGVLSAPISLEALVSQPMPMHLFSIVLDCFEMAQNPTVYPLARPSQEVFSDPQQRGSTGFVLTSHPCRAKTPDSYVVRARLSQLVSGKVSADPQAEIAQQMALWVSRSPLVQRPTLLQEVRIHRPMVYRVLDALLDTAERLKVAPLAIPRDQETLRHVLDSGQWNSYQGNLQLVLPEWTGWEADRNSTTPEVNLNTAIENKRAICEYYINALTHLQIKDLSEEARPAFVLRIRGIVGRLEGMLQNLSVLRNTVRSLAALMIYEYAKYNGSTMPKSVKDNLEQFFVRVPLKELSGDDADIEALFREAFRPDADGCVTLSKEDIVRYVEMKSFPVLPIAVKSDAVPELLRLQTGYLDRIRSHLRETYPVDSFLKDLITLEAHTPKESVLERQFMHLREVVACAGMHLCQGQGRLDSLDIRTAVGHVMRHIGESKAVGYEKMQEPDQCRLLLDHILSGEVHEIKLSELEFSARTTFEYFRAQKALNDANPHTEPMFIIANYHTARDFLEAFYLAVQAGLIEIKDGQVTRSMVWIMPLVETVADHDQAPEEFKKLLSIPVIQSYFKMQRSMSGPRAAEKGSFGCMLAYSDTTRDGGGSAGVSRLLTSASLVYDVYMKAFGQDLSCLFERYPYGYFDLTDGAQAAFDQAFAQPVPVKTQANMPVGFRIQHGRGSHGVRSGGDGVDQVWERLLPKYAQWNALVTHQPGRLEIELATPQDVAQSLENAILNNHQETSQISEALTPPRTPDDLENFIVVFRKFTDPGRTHYSQMMLAKASDWNQWAENLPLTWMIVNEMTIGSRTKVPSDPHKAKTGFIEGNRAISVTALIERTGFFAQFTETFWKDMQALIDVKGSQGAIGQLRVWYLENPVFKIYLDKMSEMFLRSNLETLKLFMDEGSSLYQGLKAHYEEGLAWLREISGSKDLLADYPGLASRIQIENRRRHHMAELIQTALRQYDPTRLVDLAPFSLNVERWWERSDSEPRWGTAEWVREILRGILIPGTHRGIYA